MCEIFNSMVSIDVAEGLYDYRRENGERARQKRIAFENKHRFYCVRLVCKAKSIFIKGYQFATKFLTNSQDRQRENAREGEGEREMRMVKEECETS